VGKTLTFAQNCPQSVAFLEAHRAVEGRQNGAWGSQIVCEQEPFVLEDTQGLERINNLHGFQTRGRSLCE